MSGGVVSGGKHGRGKGWQKPSNNPKTTAAAQRDSEGNVFDEEEKYANFRVNNEGVHKDGFYNNYGEPVAPVTNPKTRPRGANKVGSKYVDEVEANNKGNIPNHPKYNLKNPNNSSYLLIKVLNPVILPS